MAINGKFVNLTSLRQEDIPILFEWINDRSLVHYNSSYNPVHYKDHLEWFHSVTNNSDLVIFAIRLISTGSIIGTCQLRDINSVHKVAKLQIRIGNSDNRNKGLGTEVVNLLLNFAFNDLNLNRVFLNVHSDNLRAIKVYKKVGFKVEGELRESVFIDGKYKNIIIMGILRHDYSQ